MTHRAVTLIGRDRELEILMRFLEHAATDGGAFVLVGEPGAGKTALLDAAADAAEEAGTGVLRAAGAEFEADLAYSGLHQVLLPVFGQFERLGATHRDALNVALGYGEGPPPDRLLVSTATLTVLLQAAKARPRPGPRCATHSPSFRNLPNRAALNRQAHPSGSDRGTIPGMGWRAPYS
jgi:hypothetical protein